MELGYLDAGSGSMLAQAIAGGAAGVAVAFRLWWTKISKRGAADPPSNETTPSPDDRP